MGRPCSIQRDQSTSVDSPAKDVFGHEFALVPYKKLADSAIDSMLSLADTTEPVPIGVVAVFEPLINEHIGCIVVKTLAHEFAHPKMWLFPSGRVALRHAGDNMMGRKVAQDNKTR